MNRISSFYHYFSIGLISVFILSGVVKNAHAQDPSFQFFRDGIYDPQVPEPQKFLGFPVGKQPARYLEATRYLQHLADNSDRVNFHFFGETFEGRALCYVTISSEQNLANLDNIRSNIASLSDPRRLNSPALAIQYSQTTPAIVWLMYGVHGDELSGPDAAIQLAYQLAAGEDSVTQKIRQELVVCIHPMENPDGRERFLAQVEHWSGRVVHDDFQSIQHSGTWPWGRGNHYLFDLNRDYILLINPETRARVKEILDWNPQLIVDAHEMGSMDTYLFSPAREPIHPQLQTTMRHWLVKFARDQAEAFDQYGWSYYTREWLEDWYPGYASSWPFFLGAVGILYEQAGTDGSVVRRPEGTVLTFRESVHHQFVSSIANLKTAASNRTALLQNYYQVKKDAISPVKSGDPRAFYIVPGKNPSRTRQLVESLMLQGIEVEIAEQDFMVKAAHGYLNKGAVSRTLPAGTYLIHLSQPLRPLILALLEFDPRMSTAFLKEERESLLQEKQTRLYEVSSWSLPMAYGAECYWTTATVKVKSRRLEELPDHPVLQFPEPPRYGFLIDYTDDSAINTLVHLFQKNHKIRVANQPFQIEGKKFERGTLLLRNHENSSQLYDDLQIIIQQTGSQIVAANSALVQEGPDLGGNKFRLLQKPKIAILAGEGISTTGFSALWFLLDHELTLPHSIINIHQMGNIDLRQYNVLIIPSGGYEGGVFNNAFGKAGIEMLKSWVANGGTLIGIGNAAAFLADTTTGLAQTRQIRQVLKRLELNRRIARLDKDLAAVPVDSLTIWEGNTPRKKEIYDVKTVSPEELSWLEKQDELFRRFQPRGAILRAQPEPRHWLNFGLGSTIPVTLYTSYAFIALDPVQTAVELSDAARLRLSGLLWPEAGERWANTAFATVEPVGKGQIILFAGEPYFRGYFKESGRLLLNAILLGPGMGASHPIPGED